MIQTQTDRIVTNPDEGFVTCAPLAFQEDQIETMEMEGIVGGNKGDLLKKVIKEIVNYVKGKAIDKAVEWATSPPEEEDPITIYSPYPGVNGPRRG